MLCLFLFTSRFLQYYIVQVSALNLTLRQCDLLTFSAEASRKLHIFPINPSKMKFSATLGAFLGLLPLGSAFISTIATGPEKCFTKPGSADFNLPQNQDCFAPNLCFSRGNSGVVCQPGVDSCDGYGPDYFSQPMNAQFAIGTTADIGSLTLQNFPDAVGFAPPSVVGTPMVAYIPSIDTYFDFTITQWGGFNAGAPVSWCRSTLDFGAGKDPHFWSWGGRTFDYMGQWYVAFCTCLPFAHLVHF